MIEQPPIIFSDIDSTLATDLVSRMAYYYNDIFGLGIHPETIKNADALFPNVFSIPEIAAVRQRIKDRGSDAFERTRALVREHPGFHERLPVMPGSVEGIQQLVDIGFPFGGYETVRPNTEPMKAATQRWLTKNGFLQPDKLGICKSPADKLERILRAANGKPVALIDDGLEALIKDAQKMDASNLLLIGFGSHIPTVDIYLQNGLRVFHLPNWAPENVQKLAQQLFPNQG